MRDVPPPERYSMQFNTLVLIYSWRYRTIQDRRTKYRQMITAHALRRGLMKILAGA